MRFGGPWAATCRHTPNVTKLDLSQNRLSALAHLDALTQLRFLNLSYNRLTTMMDAGRSLGNVSTLILRGNQLTSARGLERLLGLTRLDLRDNQLQYGARALAWPAAASW